MKCRLWLSLGMAFVWACVVPAPVKGQAAHVSDCFNEDVALPARVVACRAAAEQGDAWAQFALGNRYDQGEGVPQDYGAAVEWYRRAAAQGIATAQTNLGVKYAQGEGVPEDDTLAHMWFNLAGASGHKKAREARDVVAQRMTPAQRAQAQRLAREWVQTQKSETE